VASLCVAGNIEERDGTWNPVITTTTPRPMTNGSLWVAVVIYS